MKPPLASRKPAHRHPERAEHSTARRAVELPNAERAQGGPAKRGRRIPRGVSRRRFKLVPRGILRLSPPPLRVTTWPGACRCRFAGSTAELWVLCKPGSGYTLEPLPTSRLRLRRRASAAQKSPMSPIWSARKKVALLFGVLRPAKTRLVCRGGRVREVFGGRLDGDIGDFCTERRGAGLSGGQGVGFRRLRDATDRRGRCGRCA